MICVQPEKNGTFSRATLEGRGEGARLLRDGAEREKLALFRGQLWRKGGGGSY